MNSVERVKALCKERKIPISKLEKDLGYGTGYIAGLKKGVFPDDRLFEIADYLNVSPSFILTGEKENKPTFESELTEKQKRAFEIIMSMSESSLERFIETAEMFGK